jgi:hypothetical protein
MSGDAMDTAIELTDGSFEERVLAGLLHLRGQLKGINDRLDKLNGSVASQDVRLRDVERSIALRENSCPLIDAFEERMTSLIDTLHDAVTELAAEKRVNAIWWGQLLPYIKVIAWLIALLVVYNAKELLQHIGIRL